MDDICKTCKYDSLKATDEPCNSCTTEDPKWRSPKFTGSALSAYMTEKGKQCLDYLLLGITLALAATVFVKTYQFLMSL